MAKINIPDYKLDEGFLKEIVFELLRKPSAEDFTVQLPISVQVIETIKSTGAWNSYILADGEFQMSECVFMSEQAKPESFSILKIKNISKLPLHMRSDNDDLSRLGEIEFEIEVNGEEIGFSLYQDLKDINMKELIKRKRKIGLTSLKKTFESPKPVEIMKYMWKNRSEKFCDVKFTFEGVKSDEDVVVYANKNVLSGASEVFRTHFDNERFIDNNSVHIVDASSASFNKLLEFIYKGKVQFTTWRVAFELLYLSKKYLISHLEDLCQNVILDFCNYDGENILKVFEQNKKINDKYIEDDASVNVYGQIYEVINSQTFLNCEFSTIEWILSLDDLNIDEWTLLCAVYKWAFHNKVTAFCQREGGENGDPRNCLHALLECVRYQNIDTSSLQRFLKLPKLPELIDVSELKLSIFDSLLEDDSYLDNGTNFYPKSRYDSSFCVEIEIGRSEEKEMKNIHMSGNGPVLGFKIKQEILDNGELSLDLILSFQYLYSKDQKKHASLYITVAAKPKSKIVECDEDVNYVERRCTLTQEWSEFGLHLEDYRGYVSDKIEDFGGSFGNANKSKILSFLITIDE